MIQGWILITFLDVLCCAVTVPDVNKEINDNKINSDLL